MRGEARIFIFFLAAVILSSCSNKDFNVTSFEPFVNYTNKSNDTIYPIKVDLNSAVLYGIEIPGNQQINGGKFVFSFKLKNLSGKKDPFYYKLFYQNNAYKWDDSDSLSFENFYGSWEDTEIEFKEIPAFNGEITVTDSFKIVGNPRNEKIYYGIHPEDVKITPELLALYTKKIYEEPDWKNSVLKKSFENKISEQEQVYFECLWAINNRFQNDTTYNNRWKRNPRVGNYSFMLVVCNGNDLGKIPKGVKDISKTEANGNYINPYNYFLHGEGKKLKETQVSVSRKQLAVSVTLNPGSGIYIDPFKINSGLSKEYYNSTCGESNWLYHNAQFAQYFHHINRNYEFVNIKEAMDVVDENLSKEKYNSFISDYTKNHDFVHTFASIPNCPCKTVSSDSSGKAIKIANPGNKYGEFRKEHVGITSRVGFTYGKWRAKIKFPKIISKENVWNGLTTAFWLIFQSEAKWNIRRPCDGTNGYIPKNAPDNAESVNEAKRQINYSEIDFELLKESKYWTKAAYGGKEDYPKEDASKNSDITICCTNWDMACNQPSKYIIGAKTVEVDGKKYEFARWDFFSKLLTSKVAVSHEEVFNDNFYYFEIDWQPKQIVWRIGKDKKNLREICRMNDEITTIPNNQMVMVMSQEFHYQEWWPTAPFMQNFIPFPKNDLIGTLLEVEIE